LERSLITEWSWTCFGHSRGHLQVSKNNNTNKILMCRHKSTAKNHTILVQIVINDKTAISIKYYNLKIVAWNVVLFNDGHMSGRNMSVVIMK
jgi:hypothetical protein